MESHLISSEILPSAFHAPISDVHTFELAGYYYSDRVALLPQLTSAFVGCGGWVLERRTISATSMDFRFEIQLSAVLDLYGELLALGVDLTRAAHTILTELCTCRKHSGLATAPRQVLTFCLGITFLGDVTLHSLLMTGSGAA